MRLGQFTTSLLMVLALALSVPSTDADAKAGGGQSSGSRGSRTYQQSPSGAQPMQRSTAPQPAPQAPPAPQPGPFQRPPQPYAQPVSHPFLKGIAGGLIGASVAHMLFGSGGMGMGMGTGGGGGPGLLHFLILGLLLWVGYRVVRSLMGRSGGGGIPMPSFGQQNAGYQSAGMPVAPPASQPLMLTEDDRSAFGQSFLAIQSAWSDQDFHKLQQLMTPEMVHYFNEQLSANTSRSEVNKVEQVQIQGIDQVESWQEAGLAYASVLIRWTARDYMVKADHQPGDFAGGTPSTLSTPDQEQWTFVRAQGGHWLLSAIQQMR